MLLNRYTHLALETPLNSVTDGSYLNHSLALPVHLSANLHSPKVLCYLQNEFLVAVFASEQPVDYRLLT